MNVPTPKFNAPAGIGKSGAAATDALRASERDFRTFFEMLGVGNVIADARTNRFLRVNRHFCELTGYSAAELQEMTTDELTHPDDLKADRAGWKDVQRNGTETFAIEKRYRTKDGRTVWVQVTSTIVRDTAGEPLHALGVVRDVTDRRLVVAEAERLRRESETGVFRRIGQALHDHLCQHLLGAAFAAKALANQLPAGSPLRADANDLAQLINSAVQQIRDIVGHLREDTIRQTGENETSPSP